jgi:DnaJ domain
MSSNITIEKSYQFGLTRSASIDEIKSTYRQMAKAIHPDLNPSDTTALDRFNTLNLTPHDRQRWEAVNREFNRIERLLK